MEVIADLHVHSHYSIATGREADLEHLDLWGRYKGVQVVGAGDCTHPLWLAELEAKLEPVAPGVYELRPGLSLPLNLQGPRWEAVSPVRFVITGEVSTIYRKAGRVRKVHLVLLLSGLEVARKLSQRLGRLGNVQSDGRPIFGVDAKNLLAAVLEIDPDGIVIPAHIWTPWFSVLGSKSGFDSLEECFEDQLCHVFALETGLSSDPFMNWQVSALDRFLLVSNSDAHSPQKLGREANTFSVPPTFPDLARAIRSKEGFAGTIEFFPQEGKYHLDGHRQCALRLTPEKAQALGGVCPRCGKPLTLGVLHRVLDLADRVPGAPPAEFRPYESLVALPEVLSEIQEAGPGSKKVRERYFRLLERLGPELEILRRVPLADLAREGGSLLAHGIERMRRGEVTIAAGYDGAYGEVHLFTPEERRRLAGQGAFFSAPAASAAGQAAPAKEERPGGAAQPSGPGDAGAAGIESRKLQTIDHPYDVPLLASLNSAQRAAVLHQGPPLLVQAGPGTGKTRALTHRLAYLLAHRRLAPGSVLALTFTRQAAGEMAARIQQLLPGFPGLEGLTIKTFHALGQQFLAAYGDGPREVADNERRRLLLKQVAREHHLPGASLERQITLWKQALRYPDDLGTEEEPSHVAAFRAYETILTREGLWDYEDLIARPALLLAGRRDLREACQGRYRHLLVDEYQDLNAAQYQFFQGLAGPEAEIMVIGDPDQAIYGFRGGRPEYFGRFLADWPHARQLFLDETYRLPGPLLLAAQSLRAGAGGEPTPMITRRPGSWPVVLLEAAGPEAEGRAIARQIEKLVGGLSHRALEDAALRHQDREDKTGFSFKDVAVLYRLHALGPELERQLAAAGIPCQQAREGIGPDWDGIDLAAERVKLLTLHAAKGLEFPYIFIAGCEAGLIPWEGSPDPAEEQRLFYVGLTRASRQVFLSCARTRSLGGPGRRTLLSPLAQAIPPELIQRAGGSSPRKAKQPHLFPETRPDGANKAK